MSLLDTIDGSFMNFAYGWAFSKPVRKVYYNITVTGLSVRGRAGHRDHRGRSRSSSSKLDLTPAASGPGSEASTSTRSGSSIVGLFVATWALALAVWRFGHIEDRWSPSRERV